jgi:hypothetical protein
VSTSGFRQIQVTAHRQAPAAPPVRALKLWISYDRGANWQLLNTVAKPGNQFTGRVKYAAGTGKVSIKAEAWDAAGNSTEQILYDGYGRRP